MPGLQILANILPDVFGGQPQRQFAQSEKIAFTKKVGGGSLRAVWHIDFPLRQSFEKFIRRQVNQFNFGVVQH